MVRRGAPPTTATASRVGMRPLIVRGARTMIIDAGLGRQGDAAFDDTYGVDHRYDLDRALADARLAPEDIDIVLASHLHFDHAGGFTSPRREWPAPAAFSARAVHRPPRRVGGRDARPLTEHCAISGG